MNNRQNFADTFCQKCQCPRADFAETVFWRCLPPGRKFLVRLIWWCNPELFQGDLYLINEAGNATTVDEVRRIIHFFEKQPATRSFIRRRLKARLSKGKLQSLASAMLGESITS